MSAFSDVVVDDDTGTGRPDSQSRTARDRGGAHSYLRSSGTLGVVAIPAAELLHPPGRVKDTRLPGVERMSSPTDLNVTNGVGTAMLPLDGALTA